LLASCSQLQSRNGILQLSAISDDGSRVEKVVACRFPRLLCRKALANPFGGIGMVSKSESSLVLASISHQDRVFRRDNRIFGRDRPQKMEAFGRLRSECIT
jgi:hypothetical protein